MSLKQMTSARLKMSLKAILVWVLFVVFASAAYADEDLNGSTSDEFADEIAMEQPKGRIISLAPHLTEMLFAIGAGDEIVGTVSFSER